MKTIKIFISLALITMLILACNSCTSEKPLKIYIMAGQSNMEGPGQMTHLDTIAPALLVPRDDVWCVYAGRVSGWLKPGFGFRPTNFGPELKFGHIMGDNVENEIVIFKSAIGGTTIEEDWRSPSIVDRSGGEIGPLYKDMLRRFHIFIANLEEVYPNYHGQGFEIAGIIWFQGENDSCEKDEDGIGFWTRYRENLEDFITDVKNDIGSAELPVILVQINDGLWDRDDWGGPVIRKAQKEFADSDENISIVVTMDLNEGYHYDSYSHVVIGERIAEAMLLVGKETVKQNMFDIKKAGSKYLNPVIEKVTYDLSSLNDQLIGYWKFDEGLGIRTIDNSSNSFYGIISEEATWTNGKFGNAVKIKSDQCIKIPDFAEPLNKDGRIEELSLSFWVSTPGKVGYNRIGKGTGTPKGVETDDNWFISSSANLSGWDIGNFNYDGFPAFTASIEDGKIAASYSSWGEPVIDGDGYEWHHVALVFDGPKAVVSLYVDGQLVNNNHKSNGPISIIPSETSLKIGGGLQEIDNYQIFDELAIWSRSLTPGEVAKLYNYSRGSEIRN
jgi:alpha-galactosidase